MDSSKRSCYDIVVDPDDMARRLDAAVSRYSRLDVYRTFLRLITEHETEQPGACRGLSKLITERAYEAEAQYRLLVKDGINTLNELRDSGELPHALRRATNDSEGGTLDFEKIATKAKSRLAKSHPNVPARLIDEMLSVVEERGISAKLKDDTLEVRSKDVEGRKQRISLMVVPQAGAPARISVAQFFGESAGDGGMLSSDAPTFVPESCHHRNAALSRPSQKIDLYGSAIAGMSTVNQMMYRHARNVEEVGHGPLRGNDVVSLVVGIVVAVVGVVLLIVGACTGDWGLIAGGIVLIAGGICVAVGACSLSLLGITIIQA